MIRKSQIIIGAHIEELPAVGKGQPGLLGRRDDPFAFIKIIGSDLIKSRA